MSFQIGWGEGIITPSGYVSLCGQYHIRVSEKPKEDIRAIAVAMVNGDKRVFWAACDLCGIYDPLREEAVAAIGDRIPGITADELIISATHIHTGPYLLDTVSNLNGNHMIPDWTTSADECRRMVAEGIAEAVVAAWETRRESFVKNAVSRVQTGVNRRSRYTDGTAAMYGNVKLEGYLGAESRDGGAINLLYTYDAATNALTGVIANVPCTAQVIEGEWYITPDYWGVVRKNVAAELGVPVMGLIASAGDGSPHRMYSEPKCAANTRSVAGCQELGERVAKAIIRQTEHTLQKYDGADFNHKVKKVELPFWPSTKEEYEASSVYIARLKSIYGEDLNYEEMRRKGFNESWWFSKALAEIKRYQSPIKSFNIDVHCVRIGGTVLITNPFELYYEFADRMRAPFRGIQLMDVELAGHCHGYLPTWRAVRGRGYSATIFNGSTDPDGGNILVEESIALIREILGE
ncbi:MAG: hypothetical protein E7463_11435 [Ruminococcaceae bacterium]|nr:hypothetical protein [Oscillospiraceae bacterium]